jgi:hypothetical protein
MSRAPKLVRYVPPVFDAAQIALLADRVLAQDVVTVTIEETVALLAELKARGYGLKQRTEWERRETPWLLLVVPSSSGKVADR